jgi:hypothetical protein
MRTLLWVDCLAGGVAGAAVLALSGWLAELYLMPRPLVVVMGAANLLYASYSFSLAARTTRPKHLITLLVFANLTWSGVCLALAANYAQTASLFGIGHLVLEAIFVGGLAGLEWSNRDRLLLAG